MGCAICLDDFNQADGETKRATALTCGHIFHYDCLQTWFYGPTAAVTHRPNHQLRCPLCAGQTDPAKMVKLFPSDGDDLDKYLSGQQQWELVPLQGEAADDHKNLKQLLADLMDFNSAVQSYVMATHGVRCDIMVKSGLKVRKLFVDLAKDMSPDLKDALLKSMDSLDNAASCFSTMFNDLSRRCRNNRKLQVDLLKEKDAVKKSTEEAKNLTNIAAAKLREVENKSKEAGERMERATSMENHATDMIIQVSAREDALNARQQSLEAQRRRMELDTNLKLSNMKNSTETSLNNMRIQMNLALQKSADAEKERQAAHNKSCQLAQQLQQLQQRFKNRKQKGAGSSPLDAVVVDDVEAMQRRITALEARNKSMEEQLRMANIVTPEHRLSRNSHRRTNAGSIDLTRSSSPLSNDGNTSPATPLDGVDLTSQASSSSVVATADPSPSVQRKGKKRARASLSVEPERLDDEMDEALFPMPGLVPLQMPASRSHSHSSRTAHLLGRLEATSTASTVSTGHPRASNGATAASATNKGKSPARKGADDSNSSKKRKRASTPSSTGATSGSGSTSSSNTRKNDKTTNYEWLKKTNGIALGPKHRSKAA